ncbi:unnamed protein product [Brachionus calyciflorus]|uniref:Apple domain-containing protein n=1 Tax=Brachionus calyciflorus TaxID=104777 RepID=A0A813N5L7_9BILA|nr:unnamed protein product [Brachionus calyciflorus]
MSAVQHATKALHRVPLIKFKYGLRPQSVAHEVPKQVETTKQVQQKQPSIDFFQLPKKYHRRPISKEEMEAINYVLADHTENITSSDCTNNPFTALNRLKLLDQPFKELTLNNSVRNECFHQCKKNEYCVSFSYDLKNNLCFLYNSTKLGYTIFKSSSWYTVLPLVYSSDHDQFIILSDLSIGKYEIKLDKISNASQCMKICFDNSNCNQFTFDLDSLNCYLSLSNSLNNFYFNSKSISGIKKNILYENNSKIWRYQVIDNLDRIKYVRSYSDLFLSGLCKTRSKRNADICESIDFDVNKLVIIKNHGRIVMDSVIFSAMMSEIYATFLAKQMIKFQVKQAARMALKPMYSIPFLGAALAAADIGYTIYEIATLKKEANKRAKVCCQTITDIIDGSLDLDSIPENDIEECQLDKIPKCSMPPHATNIIFYGDEINNCRNKIVSSKCELNCRPGFKESTIYLYCTEIKDGGSKRYEWRANEGNPNHDYSCDLENDKCIRSNDYSYIYDSYVRHPTDKTKRIIAYSGKFNIQRKLPLWSVTVRDYLNNYNEFKLREFEFNNCPYTNLERSQLKASDFNGYHRGHLVPFSITTYSKKAAKSSFWYTNAAPQNSTINSGKWMQLERENLNFGEKTQKNILIITGICPRFYRTNIPECFWKLICFNLDNREYVIGFYHTNTGTYEPYVSQNFILGLLSAEYVNLNDAWNKAYEILISRRAHGSNINVENCKTAREINQDAVNFYIQNKNK